MSGAIREQCRKIIKNTLYATPQHLKSKQIRVSKDGMDAITQSIKDNYHVGWRSESCYTKEEYENDLKVHLYGRLELDRNMVVPWIDNATTLKDKRILEIGCGTGSSTVALAEQGAKVIGIDIDEGALCVARDRSQVYGVDVEYRTLNADQMMDTFGVNAFDVIIYFACLEHMTVPERLASLKQAWDMLPNEGLLIIVETPNRLWYYDEHTSYLPFFNWLPDDLAFQYSKFSKRNNFRELYNEYNEEWKEHFLRRGRGMSFHELEMAICPAQEMKVVSSLSSYEGIRYKIRKSRLERSYKSLMMKIYPNVHEGFFDNSLYLILKK